MEGKPFAIPMVCDGAASRVSTLNYLDAASRASGGCLWVSLNLLKDFTFLHHLSEVDISPDRILVTTFTRVES